MNFVGRASGSRDGEGQVTLVVVFFLVAAAASVMVEKVALDMTAPLMMLVVFQYCPIQVPATVTVAVLPSALTTATEFLLAVSSRLLTVAASPHSASSETATQPSPSPPPSLLLPSASAPVATAAPEQATDLVRAFCDYGIVHQQEHHSQVEEED